jgi:deoxyribodipyrimidine photolyase-related protein
MSSVSIIFPHQLFKINPALATARPVILLEEFLFFRQYNFHRQKLILHRASMKAYEQELQNSGYQVEYIPSADSRNNIIELVKSLSDKGIHSIHVCNPSDYLLSRRLHRAGRQNNIKIEVVQGPDFLTDQQEAKDFFSGKVHYHQTDFYIRQRKHLNILIDQQQKPIGGKWSMDAENRKKVPKDYQAPSIGFPPPDGFLTEAIAYVNRGFKDNPGLEIPETNRYPWAWTRKGAFQLLHQFVEERLSDFGDYEDAMPAKEKFLQHSVLSPMINIGLLTPTEVLQCVLEKMETKSIPINSTEGFVRQIIGWREFIRIVYMQQGVAQRTTNYWGFKRKIPASFYTGNTGIIPIDNCIQKLHSNAYLHHIERLMILGNFFLLCEFDPDEVYRWFMELFIDAYDWVMVPNIYGMTQFADGGLMMTKPYISGSNYIFKMSDYKKDAHGHTPGWQDIWDGLFWRFMDKQRSFFLRNPRLGMLVNTYDKMNKEKQSALHDHANHFLNKLDKELEESSTETE